MPDCDIDQDPYGCVVDPPCATDYKEWLNSKVAYFKMINNKVNFAHN